MKKPEPLPKFIARMKGREFTAGDVETWCKIPEGDVAERLRPYRESGRVVTSQVSNHQKPTFWRAI